MYEPSERGVSAAQPWLERQGIVRPLAWGYVAMLLFMVGDGVEVGFLATYLEVVGFTTADVATLVAVYGVVVALASWLSGALVEAWGPRRVMMIGLAVWVIFHVIFLTAGVATKIYPIMLVAYAIRGLGYPFFAFGFLIWVTTRTPDAVLSRAMGWYWFSYTAGLGVLSAYLAGFTIPRIGSYATLWVSLAFVVAGGLMAIFLIRARSEVSDTGARATVKTVIHGLSVVRTTPRIGSGVVLRIINGLIFYSLPLYFASYLINDIGFSISQWQTAWGTMLLACLPGNLAAGYLSDRVGAANVVAWAGGFALAASLVGWYSVPHFLGTDFGALLAVAVVSGIGLGGFTPVTAMVALLAAQQRAAALAIANLGAGLSNAVGPAIVRLFLGPLGIAGLTLLFAGLYAACIPLAYILRQKGMAPVRKPDTNYENSFG
jgi:polyol permease family